MRARFALKMAGISCYVREISLKHKPDELLKISPKGTVPVLLLPDGQAIDESIEIIQWAFRQNDPENISSLSKEDLEIANQMIKFNDKIAVKIIHKYKYRELYPHENFHETEKNLHEYFKKLNLMLEKHKFFLTDTMSIADIAIFPFIRQIAQIDKENFKNLGFKSLSRWLDYFLEHSLFPQVMANYPLWSSSRQKCIF